MDLISPDYVALYQGDQPVPVKFIETPDGTGMLFLSETETKRMGDVGGYVLVLGQTGVEMEPAEQAQVAGDASCQAATLAVQTLEQDNEYRSTAPTDLPWFWQALRAPDKLDVTLILTDAVGQSADLTLTFWAQSRMPQEPDHQIRLELNGEELDDHFWDAGLTADAGMHTWTVSTPSIAGNTHSLSIISPGETEAPVEMTWLDRIEIAWMQQLRFHPEDWSSWTVDRATKAACFQAGKDGDDAVALLETENGEVVFFDVTLDAGMMIPHSGYVRGWLGVPWQAAAPAVLRRQETIDDTIVNNAEYIVLADAQWHSDLEPLLARRRAEGLSVAILTPGQVYDTYGDGTPDAAAINAMVKELKERGDLRYLLLVGKASADPRMLWLEPDRYVPTSWIRTFHVGDTSSDVATVSGDDEMPMVAVGRFLPENHETLQLMVAKTLSWLPNDRLMIVNDNEPQFVSMSQNLAKIFEPDLSINSGDEDARSAVLAWLDADPGTFIYTGHGSLPVLGDEKILTFEDAAGWKGPTVVVAWSCLCGTYAHPVHTGLGEAWLQGRDGTAAFVGPTGETTTGEQSAMASTFQQALVDGARLGDALFDAWGASVSRDARLSFVLLGDPALQPFPVKE